MGYDQLFCAFDVFRNKVAMKSSWNMIKYAFKPTRVVFPKNHYQIGLSIGMFGVCTCDSCSEYGWLTRAESETAESWSIALHFFF